MQSSKHRFQAAFSEGFGTLQTLFHISWSQLGVSDTPEHLRNVFLNISVQAIGLCSLSVLSSSSSALGDRR